MCWSAGACSAFLLFFHKFRNLLTCSVSHQLTTAHFGIRTVLPELFYSSYSRVGALWWFRNRWVELAKLNIADTWNWGLMSWCKSCPFAMPVKRSRDTLSPSEMKRSIWKYIFSELRIPHNGKQSSKKFQYLKLSESASSQLSLSDRQNTPWTDPHSIMLWFQNPFDQEPLIRLRHRTKLLMF